MMVITLLGFIFSLYAEEIVVQAKKIDRFAMRGGSSVQIFNQDDLLGVENLAEFLGTFVGLATHSSRPGKTASLFFRGMENRHNTIFIDGMKVEDPTSVDGSGRLEFISLEQVERIEITKGGIIHGTGGAIIKITTKLNRKPQNIWRISYGSFDNKKMSYSFLGKKKKWYYNLNLGYQDVDGISEYPDYKTIDAEQDSFDQTTVKANLGLRLDSDKTIEGGTYLLKASTDYDEFGEDRNSNHALYRSKYYFLNYRDKFLQKIDFSGEVFFSPY